VPADVFVHFSKHPFVQGSPARGLNELCKDAPELFMQHRALALDFVEGVAGNFRCPLQRIAADVKADDVDEIKERVLVKPLVKIAGEGFLEKGLRLPHTTERFEKAAGGIRGPELAVLSLL
jgi:hypothetical protein